MKNVDQWKPSKFVINNGQLVVSKSMGVASKRFASYTAQFYNKNIPLFCKGSILDMGCGSAPFYEFYKKYASEVYCIDWGNSPNDISFIDEYCDLNSKLPIEDENFDTIILSDVITQLENPYLALSEAYRILKPNGNLLFNCGFLYGLCERPYDYYRYSNHRIRSWADKIGYVVTVEKEYGGYLDQIEHALLRMTRKVPSGVFLAKCFYQLFSLIHKFKLIKRLSDSQGTHPYGYGFVLTKKLEL